jgi:hypothetical protein
MQELNVVMNKIILKKIVTNMKIIMLVIFVVLCSTPIIMAEIIYAGFWSSVWLQRHVGLMLILATYELTFPTPITTLEGF